MIQLNYLYYFVVSISIYCYSSSWTGHGMLQYSIRQAYKITIFDWSYYSWVLIHHMIVNNHEVELKLIVFYLIYLSFIHLFGFYDFNSTILEILIAEYQYSIG